jgi:dihydrolipoamide dehydrogenase
LIDPKTERVLGVGIGSGRRRIDCRRSTGDRDVSWPPMWGWIHPHPTLSETMMESAEVFYGQATDIYRPKKA